MRRVRYGVGMSLDGFIADAWGGTGFLVSDPTYDSAPFFASIDTVLMGRVTYEAGLGRTSGSVAAACCFETCWQRIWSTLWNLA